MPSIFCMPGLASDHDIESCALEEASNLANEDICQALTLILAMI